MALLLTILEAEIEARNYSKVLLHSMPGLKQPLPDGARGKLHKLGKSNTSLQRRINN